MARIVVVLMVAIALAIVLSTSAALPPTVATHFALGGAASGFMSRAGYQMFYCGLIVFIALASYGSLAWLPARFPHLLNLPHRDYWLQDARRQATLRTLAMFGVAMAMAIVALLVAAHLLVLDAHARTPPALNEAAFATTIGVFVAVLVALIAGMYARFRTPG